MLESLKTAFMVGLMLPLVAAGAVLADDGNPRSAGSILDDLITQSWFWPAAIGVALLLFKNNPIVANILTKLLEIFTPRSAAVVSGTHSDAIEHYMALADCCKNCPEAQASLSALWGHLNPNAKKG